MAIVRGSEDGSWREFVKVPVHANPVNIASSRVIGQDSIGPSGKQEPLIIQDDEPNAPMAGCLEGGAQVFGDKVTLSGRSEAQCLK